MYRKQGVKLKLVKHTVAVALKHFCVKIKARVSKLSNFPRKKLDTVHTVAKNDALVYFQFREHSVEAVDLLTFFDEGVKLGDTFES